MSQSVKIDDQRAHPRYLVSGFNLALAQFGEQRAFEIRDLSYSGFSVLGNLQQITGDLTLSLLGHKVQANATPVYHVKGVSGFCFQHKTPQVLIFLQPYLERLRIGASMSRLSKDVVSDKYKGEDWINMQGDGPTDLCIKLSHGAIETLLLTYREGDSYHELRLRGGQLHTGMRVDQFGVAARMAETSSLDDSVARRGLFTLAGIKDEAVTALIGPILSLGNSALGIAV